MSQLSFFRKIIFSTRNMLTWLHRKIPVRWQRSLDQEAGVRRDDNLHLAWTLFFRAKARLDPAKSWKDVLNS